MTATRTQAKSALFFAILALLFSSPLAADVVHLTNGDTLEGTIEDLGDSLKIKCGGATIVIEKSRVVRVEAKKLPEQIFAEKLASLNRADAAACFDIARWCRDNGMEDEYGRMLEMTLKADPNHAEAAKLLYQYNKIFRSLPRSRAAEERLKREFGSSFRIKRTRHYRICYDCDAMFLAGRSRLFENVYKRFYLYFESNGFDLRTITDRFEAVLFDSREEFVEHIRRAAQDPGRSPEARAGLAALVKTAGYYMLREKRVVFYNAIHDEGYERQRKQIESMQRSLKQNKDMVRRSPANGTFTVRLPDGGVERVSRARLLKLIREEEKRLVEAKKRLSRTAKRDQNVETTVHEATHQLTFETGLLDPRADVPLWVVEGIAMFFEPTSCGDWKGVGRLNSVRLHDFKTLSARPDMRELVRSNNLFYSGGLKEIASAYAQAWALFYFLERKHHDDFMRYLKLLGKKQPGKEYDEAERIRDFQEILGPIEELQLRWISYMNRLR